VIERINQLKADQAKYDHYPTLDAFGQSTNAQNDTTNTLGYQYRNNQVGVQLSLPLYTGGGLEATRRQAVASFEASKADSEGLAIRIETQFDSDWAAQGGLVERAKAARSLVISAQEQKKAAEAGIKQGLKTWSDVSNAEILLARRQTDLSNVLLNLYKLQARILSLLPSDDPAWDEWIGKMDVATLP
jgi:outer membrane protein TolC